MSDFEVKVVKITNVTDHPNADRLSLTWFRGFSVVTNKLEDGSHRYHSGDLVVYVPEQAVVPDHLLREHGYWNEERNEGLLAGSKHNRVKAIKLRGVLSLGIIFRFPQESDHIIIKNTSNNTTMTAAEGDDVGEFLNIKKYDPPIPVQFYGDATGGRKVPRFDIENIKKYPDIFQDDDEVVVTEKLHGTFFGIAILPDGEPQAYSKGLGAAGLLFKNNEKNKAGNIYVKTLTNILPSLAGLGYDGPVYLMGEIFGRGVQDLHYGIETPDTRFFEMYVGVPDQGRWAPWAEVEEVVNRLGLKTVPVVFKGTFGDYKANRASYVNGKSTLADHVREGVVIKHVAPRPSPWQPSREFERAILKDINDEYLLRKNGTEFQ